MVELRTLACVFAPFVFSVTPSCNHGCCSKYAWQPHRQHMESEWSKKPLTDRSLAHGVVCIIFAPQAPPCALAFEAKRRKGISVAVAAVATPLRWLAMSLDHVAAEVVPRP